MNREEKVERLAHARIDGMGRREMVECLIDRYRETLAGDSTATIHFALYDQVVAGYAQTPDEELDAKLDEMDL